MRETFPQSRRRFCFATDPRPHCERVTRWRRWSSSGVTKCKRPPFSKRAISRRGRVGIRPASLSSSLSHCNSAFAERFWPLFLRQPPLERRWRGAIPPSSVPAVVQILVLLGFCSNRASGPARREGDQRTAPLLDLREIVAIGNSRR